MKFADLLENSKHMSPATQQRWLKKEIPTRMSEAGVRLAQKGSGAPDRIVMGIAEYVPDELRLLDSVCKATSDLGLVLEVFLMTDCSQEEIEEYLPGVGRVFQSPIVGIWKAGTLKESGSGHAARALLRKDLRLP